MPHDRDRPELPLDPDAETLGSAAAFRVHPRFILAVALGGLAGAPARYGIERALPAGHNGFPVATLLVNLSGALVLGLILEALARRGDDTGSRQLLRLGLGTGFCGTFTTFSALAVETDLLIRGHDLAAALTYALVSLLAGLLCTSAGIAIAVALHRPSGGARHSVGIDVARRGGR